MSPAVKYHLPEILGVGPGRSGTTWLHRVLEGHVDLPYGVKEVLYFTLFYDKGIDWYARHFRYATGERKVAEICPYFFSPEARARIKTDLPNCKIIITLREPVDRIYSVYKTRRHYGWLRKGTLEEVLKVRPQLGGGYNYAFHLKAWFDIFGRENVLVTLYDELRKQPQSYLDRVTDFTGVERISLSAKPEIESDVHSFARAPKSAKLARNARRLMYWLQGHQAYAVSDLFERAGIWDFCYGRGELYPRLTPEQEARLRERFLPEVEALEELLRIDLSAWKKARAARVIENSLHAD
jgi:Sulfotransferase domain